MHGVVFEAIRDLILITHRIVSQEQVLISFLSDIVSQNRVFYYTVARSAEKVRDFINLQKLSCSASDLYSHP